MPREKRRVRIKYSKTGLIFIGDSGSEYVITPVSVTGKRCQLLYEGTLIEFKIGEQGFVQKNGHVRLSSELYEMLLPYAEMSMRAVFNGYKKESDTKDVSDLLQLKLFP